jgi:dTDP-4-dehydrorhamnose reductase
MRDEAWSIAINEKPSLLKGIDVFIHAGANTDVEHCEREPAQCFKDNYFLTELLAQRCVSAGIKFIFISSTGVYGRHKTIPYSEYDEVIPTTVHHKSKRLAEIATINSSSKNLIIRTGWLFGGNKVNPKNFVNNRIVEATKALNDNKEMFSNIDQLGSPTYVPDLARQLIYLIERDVGGIYNIVNSGHASRHAYTSEILKLANIHIDLVADSAGSFQRMADVSNNEMAVNWKLELLGINQMRDWKDGLADYIRASGQVRESI